MCGDLPETTAFKSYAAKLERKSQYANYSDLPGVSFLRLTHSEASEGYPTIINNIQPCPKLCLLMPLARVGARTDSTTRLQLHARRGSKVQKFMKALHGAHYMKNNRNKNKASNI